jgi:hypothetical protein
VEALLANYSDLELIRIGIEKAFDEKWWKESGLGVPQTLSVDLSNEGALSPCHSILYH